MFALLAERILGKPLVEHVSWAMDRGEELELKAVQYFEFQTDVQTEQMGFLTDDEERWGTSPDRSVNADEFLEIKCPDIRRHMMNLLDAGAAVKEYWIQTQGQLWIGERKRTWLLSYHPDLPYALYPIERDDKFIEVLDKELHTFSERLEALSALAKDRGYFRRDSIREPKESLQERQVRILEESLLSLKAQK